MNGIFSKVLVGVSLAVVLALAVPLTMMILSIMHGESPRQLAEQEAGQADADEPAENEPQSPAFPYPKPVVQPDPGPAGETEAPAEETAAEEAAAEEEPAPARRSGRANTGTQTPVQTAPVAPAEEPAKPKNTLPKAVLAPGEAPCMVDGLDGFDYDY